MRRALALCVMLSAPVVLAAKDPVPPVSAAFAEGDFEKTVKLADVALRRKPQPDVASRLHLLRGQALAVLNKEEKAKDAFQAALRLDATAALNPESTPPDQLELFESARREVLGIVSVRANDPAAEVRIDDKPFGPAPVKAEVPVGRHEIEVSAGSRSERETVVVAWKKTSEVSITLPDEPTPVASDSPGSSQTVASNTPPASETPAAVESAADAQTQTRVKSGGGKGGSIALLAGGVVLMGAGGVGSWYALNIKSEYDRQQNPATIPTVTRVEAQRAATVFPASIAAGAVGLGMVVGGVIGLASGGADEGSGGGVAVFPTADGAQLLVEGRF